MSILFLVLVSFLATLQQGQPQAAPITCEFRVFDGADDVSAGARVLVYASGRRENGVWVDSAGRARLAPGLYDVQAIRERNGQVTAIRWLEHVLIQHYPDEEGFHLEVINFNARYGALQLKTDDPAAHDAAAFAPGDRTHPVAAASRGATYLLLVVPAARYDVRVTAKEGKGPDTWLTDIDVPEGRTRLRTLPSGN